MNLYHTHIDNPYLYIYKEKHEQMISNLLYVFFLRESEYVSCDTNSFRLKPCTYC